MTAPAGIELSADAVRLGQRWFRSWILLFRVLPFEYDDLRVDELERARGFLERSTIGLRLVRCGPAEIRRSTEPRCELEGTAGERCCRELAFGVREGAGSAVDNAGEA